MIELAETLGFNSVRSLLAGQMLPMTSKDVTEWDAYYIVKAERMKEAQDEAKQAAEKGKAPGRKSKSAQVEKTPWQDIRGLFGTRIAKGKKPPQTRSSIKSKRTKTDEH